MTAEMVVSGVAGRAVRHTPRGWLGAMGAVVDEWLIHPGDGADPVFVYVVDARAVRMPVWQLASVGPPRCVLMVGRVNHDVSINARVLDLPEWLAWDVWVLTPIPVGTGGADLARVVVRHLMRWAVDNHLPAVPDDPDAALMWATAARAVGSALAPRPRPLVHAAAG